MSIAALITARKCPICPTTGESKMKIWYVHTMEYYSEVKTNEIMNFAGRWMLLEKIVLYEITQTQKDK